MRIFTRTMVLLLIVSLTAVHAGSYFTDRGSIQIGGGFAFSSYKDENMNGRNNSFSLYPLVNFFPLPHFLLGPAFDMNVEYGSVRFDIGPRVGFAYGRNMPVIPFVWGAPQALFGTGGAGFGMEIAGGIMVPIKENFSINFGPHFWFEVFDRFGSNAIFMSASVTGLIF